MPSFQDLTTAQLKQALRLREQIESLQHKLDALLGGGGSATTTKKKVGRPGKRTMSAATKEKMAAGQKARWAKVKGEPLAVSAPKKKGGMTPEGKAKIAAAMKARWAAKKAAAA